ncbi:hypothetical protein C8F04DRAFT_1316589 [Mycena alexandri]|uniref:Uncharacterized protein n=1 Tax=Mycena alexandri TaxID=1745969 RepID=A0AAD6WPV9_9AGAR|nr:hypothetical protein C8F04DRAFT_1316589 [Mycena alexandri]
MIDKYRASRVAIRRVFPGIIIRICQFHVMQAILRWERDNAVVGEAQARPTLDLRRKHQLLWAVREIQRCRQPEQWQQYLDQFRQRLDWIAEGSRTSAQTLWDYFEANWFCDEWRELWTDMGLPGDQNRDGMLSTNNWTERAFKTFNQVFLGNRNNKSIYRLVLILANEWFQYYQAWEPRKQLDTKIFKINAEGHRIWSCEGAVQPFVMENGDAAWRYGPRVQSRLEEEGHIAPLAQPHHVPIRTGEAVLSLGVMSISLFLLTALPRPSPAEQDETSACVCHTSTLDKICRTRNIIAEEIHRALVSLKALSSLELDACEITNGSLIMAPVLLLCLQPKLPKIRLSKREIKPMGHRGILVAHHLRAIQNFGCQLFLDVNLSEEPYARARVRESTRDCHTATLFKVGVGEFRIAPIHKPRVRLQALPLPLRPQHLFPAPQFPNASAPLSAAKYRPLAQTTMASVEVYIQVCAVGLDVVDIRLLGGHASDVSPINNDKEASHGFLPGRSFVGRVLERGREVRDEVVRRGEWVVGLLDIHKGCPFSLNALTQSATPFTTIYPLCTSGWCLTCLRTTCTLWAFVCTGIVKRVWEEVLTILLAPPPAVPLPDSRPATPGASPIDPPIAAAVTSDAAPTAPAPSPLPRRAAARAVRPVPPPPGTSTAESPTANPVVVPEAAVANEASNHESGAYIAIVRSRARSVRCDLDGTSSFLTSARASSSRRVASFSLAVRASMQLLSRFGRPPFAPVFLLSSSTLTSPLRLIFIPPPRRS